MWEDYTFFKNKDGAVYGVSPRIINNGFTPQKGHREATPEEKEAFIQRAIDNASQERPQSKQDLHILALDFKESGIPTSSIKFLLGVNPDELSKNELKTAKKIIRDRAAAIKAEKEALLEAEKQRIEKEKQAALEAERVQKEEAEAAARLERRQEALRLKQIAIKEAQEAEKKAAFKAAREAEAKAKKEAALEAERKAAVEASTPRRFSSA